MLIDVRAAFSSILIITALVGCSGEGSPSDDKASSASNTQSRIIDGQRQINDEIDDASSLTINDDEQVSPPTFLEDESASELDRSMLDSINALSNKQNKTLEASSVNELEQLSEADRQSLQTITAIQTMAAAEKLAAKQVEGAPRLEP